MIWINADFPDAGLNVPRIGDAASDENTEPVESRYADRID